MKKGGRKKEAIKNWSLLAGTKLLDYGLGWPVGIFNAWFLGPAIFGVLKVIQTILNYASLSDFGLSKVLVRNIPILKGRGDVAGIRKLRNLVLTESIISTLVVVVFLWMAYFVGWHFGGALSSILIMVLTSILLFVFRIQSFTERSLISDGKFMIQSREQLLHAITTPLVSIPLVYFFGLYGAFLSLILLSLLSIFFVLWVYPIKWRFFVSLSETKRLLGVSISVFSINIADKFFWSTEMLIIPILLSLTDAGIYGFALGGINLARMIPSLIHKIVFRNMALDAGKNKSKNMDYFKKYVAAPWSGYVMLNAICLGSMFFVYKFFVNVFLHDYYRSLPIFFLLAFGVIMLQSRVFYSFMLNIIEAFRTLIFINLSFLILNLILDFWLILKFGLMGAAAASSFSYTIIPFFFMFLTFKRIYDRGIKKAVSSYLKLLVGVVLSMLGAFIFSSFK